MSKRGCELCSNPARMYCESDQASLCWNCDEKVHSANFLVAKHSRNLLCHVCQSSTSWRASGLKFGPTVSICHVCAHGENGGSRRRQANHEEDEDCAVLQESEDDDGEYYSGNLENDDDDEEEGENQVVPLSNSSSTPFSPPAAAPAQSSSGIEDNLSSTSLKRIRDSPFESEDEDGCCSSQFYPKAAASGELTDQNNGSSSSISFRPLKLQRENAFIPSGKAVNEDQTEKMKSRRAAIIGSLRKFQQEIESSAMITGLSKLSRD
ncbi:zinc finger protein CONSTANS-LIKE 12-like isoform X1 [Olea europaea var. sylvestris]|nr:zinc finger protein CONSTANS-LIKE 12-like isoform X1 [Olea europaea var. sylvestris]CAA3006892.1 zinc finger CONSTANS-LIKE 4-like [Olea europaea subsp. europaea]